MLVILCLLITALFCLTAATNTANAATYYLDDANGLDTNPGTAAEPWLTIGKAQTIASEGDTVYLRNGNYGAFSDGATVRTDWVTYKADNGHTPVFSSIELGAWNGPFNKYLHFEDITIQAAAPVGNTDLIKTEHADYVKFIDCNIIGAGYDAAHNGHAMFLKHSANIEIDGCNVYGDGDGNEPRMAFPYGIYGRFSHYITITDCEIQECGTGIVAWGSNWTISRNVIFDIQNDGINGASIADSVFEDNHIHDIRRPADAGAEIHNDCLQLFSVGGIYPGDDEYVYMENITIRRNRMYNSGGQILLWNGFIPETSGGLGAKNIVVENNLMYNSGLDAVGAHEVHVSENVSFSFVNNTVIGNTIFRAGSVITRMKNNVLDLVDLYTDDGVEVNDEDYNIIRTWWVHTSEWEQGAHTVELGDEDLYKALFTNYDSNDFTLVGGSTAIDFGNPTYAPNSDILGVSRVFPPDAGCYEYVSDPNSQIYSITASAGTEGQISPGGTIQVISGGTQTYTITANTGYQISDVMVDGNSVGNDSSYTFTNVTANHTIAAIFTYTITASAIGGGTISPSGTTQVSSGGSQTYTITQDTGHDISDVLVDGSSVGAVTSYSFTNVTANHTIAAIFTYTITASASSGGTISPSGTTQVVPGGSQAYSITVNSGYHISDVLVDGSSVGAVTSYSFTNVTADHTIAATFAINTYTITASAGSGGTISPSGTTQVNWSGTQSYTITLNAGYHISDVLVDGSSVGVVTSYSFTNVTANHTIAATFAEQDVTKPIVTNLSPQTDSIQAPLNTLVILDITDSGDGVDANSVTVKVNNNIVYTGNTNHYPSADGDCRRLGTKADYKFIYHQWKQNFDFDQPINITVNATDLAGNIMDEYSYSFKSEMRSFGENKILSSGSSNDNWGPLTTVSDSSGNIWVAWPQGVVGSRDIYVGKLVAGTDSFVSSGVVPVTNDIPDQGNPVIAVDSSDKLYLAWQDNRYGEWDIFVSTSTDGINWSAETRVTDSNDNQINPAIVVNSSNNTYIVWQDDRHGNQDIYVAESSNGFVTKTPITSDPCNQAEPAIAADSDNTIYVVWTDTRNSKNDIYGAASNGSWTNIPIVTEEESQSNPAIATEADGSILHLVWLDDTPGDDDIYYATSDGLPASPLTGSSIIDPCEPGADQISPVIITTGYTGNDLRVFACWRDERNKDVDLYAVEIGAGAGTNVFVGDDDTSTDQSEPAIGIDGYGHPYLVWINERMDICYAGSTFIEPVVLASSTASVSSKTTVGTVPGSITNIDDVSTEVPQGAYLCDVKVTISRIRNPHKPPSNNRTFLYEFGPSGTTFSEPVTITIPYNATTLVSSPSAYWYNPLTGLYSQEGITDVEVIQISSGLYALRFKTTHFSIFGGGGPFGGGGGGGGCSMSPNNQGSIVEFLLPYIGLTVVMTILKLRDRRKNKMHDITKSEC